MEFGVQFFPSVGPDLKSAEQYWGEALALTQLAERLSFANVRTVEHYFHPYGGYSPDPLIFLTALNQEHEMLQRWQTLDQIAQDLIAIVQHTRISVAGHGDEQLRLDLRETIRRCGSAELGTARRPNGTDGRGRDEADSRLHDIGHIGRDPISRLDAHCP